MRILPSLLVALLVALSSQPARSEDLPDIDAVRHLADGIMGSVGAGNFNGTLSQLHEHMRLPANKQKELDDQFGMLYTTTLVQYGQAIGSEFIKQGQVGDSIFRLQYIAKYERSATRWLFLFYKTEKGWTLIDVRLDPNLYALFTE